jgi:hypothetical protein
VTNRACFGTDAFGEAIGDDSNVVFLDGSCASHGVSQVRNHSKVAPQGAEVADVRKAQRPGFAHTVAALNIEP